MRELFSSLVGLIYNLYQHGRLMLLHSCYIMVKKTFKLLYWKHKLYRNYIADIAKGNAHTHYNFNIVIMGLFVY